MKKQLSYNPATGMEVMFHDEGDRFFIEHRQDISNYLALNKASRDAHENYLQKGVEHYLIASFPPVEVVRIRDEYGLDIFNPEHKEDIARKILNNSDYQHVRTTPGII